MRLKLARRQALGAGAGLAAFSLLWRPGGYRPSPLLVVEQSPVRESRHFTATLVGRGRVFQTLAIGHGMDELLHNLEGRQGLVAGLTSDPAAMIAAQLLVEAGARQLLWWRHFYERGGWWHSAQGKGQLLAQSRDAWPAAVAHQLADMIDGRNEARAEPCRSGACGLPASSPGMLVSWAYEMRA